MSGEEVAKEIEELKRIDERLTGTSLQAVVEPAEPEPLKMFWRDEWGRIQELIEQLINDEESLKVIKSISDTKYLIDVLVKDNAPGTEYVKDKTGKCHFLIMSDVLSGDQFRFEKGSIITKALMPPGSTCDLEVCERGMGALGIRFVVAGGGSQAMKKRLFYGKRLSDIPQVSSAEVNLLSHLHDEGYLADVLFPKVIHGFQSETALRAEVGDVWRRAVDITEEMQKRLHLTPEGTETKTKKLWEILTSPLVIIGAVFLGVLVAYVLLHFGLGWI